VPNSDALLISFIAQDLVNAHTDYGPIPNSTPMMYYQKTYTANLLARIAASNPILSTLNITLEHNLPIPVSSKLTLSKLCTLGANDPTISQQVMVALMAELTTNGRPPLLLTLDGLSHVMKNSEYMSASFHPIHAHDFYLTSMFMSYLRGTSALPNGGAVLAAMTKSNGPTVPTLDFRLHQLEKQQSLANGTLGPQPEDPALPFLLATGQQPSPIPQPDPFYRYDQRVLDVFSGLQTPENNKPGLMTTNQLAPVSDIQVKRLKGMSKVEAKGLMEYWAKSGMLRYEISERFVGEKWAVAGGGLPGELERGCLGMRA
jgi:small subunit ribosomal protein S29